LKISSEKKTEEDVEELKYQVKKFKEKRQSKTSKKILDGVSR
jgi:hypothetical protein